MGELQVTAAERLPQFIGFTARVRLCLSILRELNIEAWRFAFSRCDKKSRPLWRKEDISVVGEMCASLSLWHIRVSEDRGWQDSRSVGELQ